MASHRQEIVHDLEHEGHRYRARLTGAPAGTAPAVFFVSGAFQSMRSWRRFERHLSDRVTFLSADLPGMGEADLLPRQHGLDFLADAAVRLLDELHLPSVHVVSASYGTPIAYRMAQRSPERLESLILAGTMREIPAHLRDRVQRTVDLVEQGRGPEFIEGVMDGLLCRDPRIHIERRRLVERLFRKGLASMSGKDLQHYRENTLRLLTHPPLSLDEALSVRSLVFTGEHDVFTTPEQCREIAAAIDGCRFTTIHDADHLFHLQRFDAVAVVIERFILNLPLEGIPFVGPIESPSTIAQRTRERAA